MKNVVLFSFVIFFYRFKKSENASSNKLEPPLRVHRVRADNSLKCKERKGIINLMVDRSNNLFENETLKKKRSLTVLNLIAILEEIKIHINVN